MSNYQIVNDNYHNTGDTSLKPDEIPGLLAWFDPTPLADDGGLELDPAVNAYGGQQILKWHIKGKFMDDPVAYPSAGPWIGYDNGQNSATGTPGPWYVSAGAGGGGYVVMNNGYFQDPLYTNGNAPNGENGYTALTGVGHMGIMVSVYSSQSMSGQSNNCCPPLLDVNYHGITGNAGSSLFSTTAIPNGPVATGAGFVNGQLAGTINYTDITVGNIQKDDAFRFIEIASNPNQAGGFAGCNAICKQANFTDRQLWCSIGDIVFYDRHLNDSERQSLFRFMQERYVTPDGHPIDKLWESGW
jgi:hypothetical protein